MPFFSHLFLLWVPMLATIALSRRWRWLGLGLGLASSFALFQLLATLQGDPWSPGHSLADTENPVIRDAYAGATWAWIAGLLCASFLFAGWCRARMAARQ